MFNPDHWILNMLQIYIIQARDQAAKWGKTQRIRENVHYTNARKVDKSYVAELYINLKDAPEAGAFELGSGIHRKKNPDFYPILPKGKANGGADWLYFFNANAVDYVNLDDFGEPTQGKWVFSKGVSHPGVRPSPALRPALESVIPDLKKAIREKVKADLSTRIDQIRRNINA